MTLILTFNMKDNFNTVIELPDGTLTNMVDSVTKQLVNYKPVDTWYDGTAMDSSKCDGNLYRKKGNKYYRKVIDKDGELFLEKDTVAQLRAITPYEVLLLKAGVYKGVTLNGYYAKGDTPASIQYYLYNGSEVDDGGGVFEVVSIKLRHDFKDVINPLYYGCQDWTSVAVNMPKSNTTYEITSEINLKGQEITLLSGSILYFIGGKFNNGSISATRDYKIQGNYKEGLSGLTNINYGYPVEDLPLLIDVTDMPGPLKKYNLNPDGVFDNSDNFISLFKDLWFIRMGKKRPITILFPSTHRSSNRQTFLFKKPCHISDTFPVDLTILLYSDIKFEMSTYSFRSISDIENGETQLRNLTCWDFTNMSSLKIYGIGRIPTSSTGSSSNRIIFDAGRQFIKGNYYEGITVKGVFYRSTDDHCPVRVRFAKHLDVRGIHFTNSCHGFIASGNYINIDNTEASNVVGDNGISISNSINDTLAVYTRFGRVSNSYAHECQDLGISVQMLNAVVENCVVENCGNNNIANLDTYGVNNSYNAGGGFSTEILSAKNSSDRINVNVVYINCVAKNCYNYGFFNDSGGVKYIGCKVINITPTYVPGLPSESRFGTNQIRAGAAFVFGGTTNEPYLAPISIENCYIENVSFILKSRSTGSGNFFNCILKDIKGNTQYDINDIQNAKIISCQLDLSYQFNDKYKYFGCFSVSGEMLPLKTFTTAERPSLLLFKDGDYGGFDTTLNKAIYRKNNTTWVDANGETV